jgi:hypothetical protein
MSLKETNIPINIKITYDNEDEKKLKIEAISWLLREIWTGWNKISDINSLKAVTQIIKNRTGLGTYIFFIVSALAFVFFIFNTAIGLDIENGHIKTDLYLGQKNGVGYYMEEGKLKYGQIEIEWCDKNACISNKWIIIKRLVDNYYW